MHANAKVVLTIPEYTYTCIYNVQTSLYNHIFYLKVCKKVDLYNSLWTTRVHGLLMHPRTKGSLEQRQTAHSGQNEDSGQK